MPPLALLAATELDRLLRTWWRPGSLAPAARRLAYAAIALLVALPGALGIALVHPYGIAFYNELIGGVRGAAERGMLRSFWGYTSRGHLGFLDARAAPGSAVFFHRTNPESYEAYRRQGLLRGDLGYAATVDEADWAMCDQQRPYTDDEYRVWNDWGTARPSHGVYVDEVPMNLLYERPRP
jgi:hypothetical protein